LSTIISRRLLRYWPIGHQVETAYERGWAELTDGDLLGSAEKADEGLK
jgi:hypothetical protein